MNSLELVCGPPEAVFLTRERSLPEGPVALVADAGGVAQALLARLQALGIPCGLQDPAGAGLAGAESCIFLRGLDPPGPDGVTATTFQAFLEARRFRPGSAQGQRLFVTVQDLGGSFGLEPGAGPRVWHGGLAALAKAAALEWGTVQVRALDLARAGAAPEAVAEWILEGLHRGGPGLELGRRADGSWCAPRLRPRRPGAPPTLADGEVLLVTGGGRGITGACLRALAERWRLKFAILGRTPPAEPDGPLAHCATEAELVRALHEAGARQGRQPAPSELTGQARAILAGREVRATLAALRQAGSEVLFVPGDVRDPAAAQALAQAARGAWGAVHGLIHGAGLHRDALLARKTDAQFLEVFETKVLGLRNLLAATARDPLLRICCFSSASARFGPSGQVDYAAANEAVNKVCWEEYRRRQGACAVKALDWGPWGGGRVTGEIIETFRQRGVPILPVAAGAAIFREEFARGPEPAVEILCWPRGVDLPEQRPKPPFQARIVFSRASFPVIDSHRIRGRHVVPLFLVCDLVLQAAGFLRPGRPLAGLRQVRVLKGVVIDDFEAGFATTLELKARGPDALDCTLKDLLGRPRYRMTAVFAEAPETWQAPGPLALEPAMGSRAELYGPDGLFHGPGLQCLEAPVYLSDQGFEAFFAGPGQPAEWALAPDFIRLDGGAQAGGLQVLHRFGRLTLPLGFEALRLLAPAPVPEIRSCRGYLRSRGPRSVLADLHYFDPAGGPVAVVEGLSGFLLEPGSWAGPATAA